MLPVERIKEIFKRNNWMMQTRDLYAEHIYYLDIQRLIERGNIEKVRYGYYQWIDDEIFSEVATVTRLFPDAILCLDTALFYYQYSDRVPHAWHLAVSKDSNKSRFKIEYPFVKAYFVEPSILDLGKTAGKIDGHTVRIYDKERTLCDCLRYMGKMDKETFNKAIRNYVEDHGKDVSQLINYAKKLRVAKKAKTIIGVWM